MIYEKSLTTHLKRAEFALAALKDVQIDKFAKCFYKGDWRDADPQDLLIELINEVSELARAMRCRWQVDEIASEAADVANYAAIIADTVKARAARK